MLRNGVAPLPIFSTRDEKIRFVIRKIRFFAFYCATVLDRRSRYGMKIVRHDIAHLWGSSTSAKFHYLGMPQILCDFYRNNRREKLISSKMDDLTVDIDAEFRRKQNLCLQFFSYLASLGGKMRISVFRFVRIRFFRLSSTLDTPDSGHFVANFPLHI